jgi:hypothetical protein
MLELACNRATDLSSPLAFFIDHSLRRRCLAGGDDSNRVILLGVSHRAVSTCLQYVWREIT